MANDVRGVEIQPGDVCFYSYANDGSVGRTFVKVVLIKTKVLVEGLDMKTLEVRSGAHRSGQPWWTNGKSLLVCNEIRPV